MLWKNYISNQMVSQPACKKRRAEGLLEPSARNMKKRIYMEKHLSAFLVSHYRQLLCPVCGENLKIL
mgnify:FL=1